MVKIGMGHKRQGGDAVSLFLHLTNGYNGVCYKIVNLYFVPFMYVAFHNLKIWRLEINPKPLF